MDTLKMEREAKLSDNGKMEKAIKPLDATKNEKETKARDVARNTEVVFLKIGKEFRQDFKKIQKTIDEKEVKLNVDINKKVNKVAPLRSEKSEDKKTSTDRKSKDEIPKLPLSNNQIRLEDMKKKSFGQNNEQKYGLGNEEVTKSPLPNSKNKENYKELKNTQKFGKTVAPTKNTKYGKDMKKPEPSLPIGVKKSEQKKSRNLTDEKVALKKVMDGKTKKIIETRIVDGKKSLLNEKGSSNVVDKNGKKSLKYTDTGLNELRKHKKKDEVEPIIEESKPEPINEKPEPKINKKVTNPRPFSFEVRVKEYIKKKEMLAKTGAEIKYEIKKWARSPEILKKKPFSVHKPKRYIFPDRYKLKFKTEERNKKRAKFDAIVEQKQKSLKEQQLMKHMAEVRELRKTLIHSPTPIPENIMQLLKEAKKAKSDISSVIPDSDEDLFSDSEYNDLEDYNPDATSPNLHNASKCLNEHEMVKSNENATRNVTTVVSHQTNQATTPEDELKLTHAQIVENENESDLVMKCEQIANICGRQTPMLNSEEYEAENSTEDELKKVKDAKLTNAESKQKTAIIDENLHGENKQTNDASNSAEPTTKMTTYNFLLSAFKKTYSS